MDLLTFLHEADATAAAVLSPEYTVDVVETEVVPTLDDPALTFGDPVEGVKRAKRLDTCVLYVDIRDSSRISAERRPHTLARMYSAFVTAMLDCVRQEGGHVRNIIGDRVMAVFDRPNCFVAAARTAALCNTVAHRVLAPRVAALGEGFVFRCGIGIDHGTMLVTKAGKPRRAGEREFYRSLVWMGRPANVASKLTDLANKAATGGARGVTVFRARDAFQRLLAILNGIPTGAAAPAQPPPFPIHMLLPPRPATTPPAISPLLGAARRASQAPAFDHTLERSRESLEQFATALEMASLPSGEVMVRHRDPRFRGFAVDAPAAKRSTPPVLITQAVYDGLVRVAGAEEVRRHGWQLQPLSVPGYEGAVYGTDLGFVGV